MNEQELRELLTLIRGIEHYLERCLKTEQEKNEDRLTKHLQAQGVEVTEEREFWPWNEGNDKETTDWVI